jgi:hypothetical protein
MIKMKNSKGLLKILDESELDIFSRQLFEITKHESFKVWQQ